MNDHFFAGSYGGDGEKILPESRMECKICWEIYHPAIGDDYWQIPPGTPFTELPDHWSCPNCEGKKKDFMVV
ncbi:rubredoxin [Neorhizobium galegae]|uniref:Rubredoxin n=1 Tax=Neorhizobium galegae TaxID=399 RepID=A0A6A1TGV8_NEOGA|nr:rubredoxin [Neorhizobium galegae]KAB1083005.1 rubredoxin [Neorhizobium galegae]